MGINEKMTSIADGLRTLSSTSEPMGLDAMSGYISQANDTVDAQSALITQIKEALKGKGTAEGGTGEPAKKEQEITFPTITENGNYEILPDDGKVMSKAIVNVEVPEKEPVLEPLNVTVNGEYIPPQNVDGFNSVIVNVPPEVADSVLLESGTCGENAIWEFYSDGKLVISGSGATTNLTTYPYEPEWVDVKDDITSVVINEGITSIGNRLFQALPITTVTIPSSVTSIGIYAFSQCVNLLSISLPEGLTALGTNCFASCTSLKSATIPSSITQINDNVFKGCSNLEDVSLADGITLLGNGMFYNCTSLRDIILPNSITTVSSQVFYRCTNLTHITMPTQVTAMRTMTFARCTNLKSIVLSDNIAYIDAGTFDGCSNLQFVFYCGTKDQWDAITIKSANEPLFAATLHCEYEYERVGYIPFNADLCFDTGVICNQNTKLKIVFTRDSSNAMYMYGVTDSQNLQSVTAYLSSGGSWRFGNKSTSYNAVVDGDIVQTAIVSNTGIVRANTSSTFSDVNDFETIGSLILGACRLASGNIGAAQFIGKIYEFKMWNGDELILDFEPCVNNENVYGFFDTITETFIAPISTNSVEEVSVDE